MAKFRKVSKKRLVAAFLYRLCIFCVIIFIVNVVWGVISLLMNSNPVRGNGEIVYTCNGCGREYKGYFPSEDDVEPLPVYCEREITEIFETEDNNSTSRATETSIFLRMEDNGSIAGATEAAVFSRVTGNLSAQSDVDSYRFEIDVRSNMAFMCSTDAPENDYGPRLGVNIFDSNKKEMISTERISIEKNNKDEIVNVSELDPGTYYLVICGQGEDIPSREGYSDADYHITFLPSCVEHITETRYRVTQTGEVVSVCDACGTVLSTEHIWSQWYTEGDSSFFHLFDEIHRTCARCGEIETGSRLTASWEKTTGTAEEAVRTEVVREPDCTVCGIEESICSVCGYIERENLDPAGHIYSSWTVDSIPDCTTAGEKSRVCTVCGQTEREAVEPLAHNYGTPVKVSGTLLHGPIVYQETCKDCGQDNTFEDNRYKWVLPVIIGICFLSAVLLMLFLIKFVLPRVLRLVRSSWRRTARRSDENRIITVVGPRGAGKSHFVGIVVHELLERIAPSFDGFLEASVDTKKRYQQRFEDRLYRKSQKLEMSQEVSDNKYAPAKCMPLTFTLAIRKRKGFRETFKRCTIVFVDIEGESLKDRGGRDSLSKYIGKSSGLIFLLDAVRLPATAPRLDADAVKCAGGMCRSARPEEILDQVSDLIRKSRGLKKSDKIDIPTAVVLSKFDVVRHMVPGGLAVLDDSPHCRESAFVLLDWHNVNLDVQGLLSTWGAGTFLSRLAMKYKDYSCFAVSALGMHNNPASDGKISCPVPHRIEDPLLWILMKLKMINVRK